MKQVWDPLILCNPFQIDLERFPQPPHPKIRARVQHRTPVSFPLIISPSNLAACGTRRDVHYASQAFFQATAHHPDSQRSTSCHLLTLTCCLPWRLTQLPFSFELFTGRPQRHWNKLPKWNRWVLTAMCSYCKWSRMFPWPSSAATSSQAVFVHEQNISTANIELLAEGRGGKNRTLLIVLSFLPH